MKPQYWDFDGIPVSVDARGVMAWDVPEGRRLGRAPERGSSDTPISKETFDKMVEARSRPTSHRLSNAAGNVSRPKPNSVQQAFAQYKEKFDKPVPAWVSLNNPPHEALKIVSEAMAAGKPLEGPASDVVT